ncbi:MAG TPA: 2-hydroxyhepta-2,4-diene-1,7-dioate isomerase [Deltaproteobacteria bacterium]|nr:MAG: 2-hydroxyhepta-2,4-diene-1,7-dioate isomerase [Deltaproteobacteria bacterium GWB2_65_81]OGP38302.1 MAG: 2-hydroxyhepta-2,4-diene-1,7-dioate isomerase [Deltaproteobacteria bacterium GWC2_66_88]HAM32790.1 2-hydroxyhepta-2,4-diene-1,7-dioate isomerase [Deltaproteobacteria bacterium]HBG73037.1 2-hydroxyhepta-2,4-diene-1,7-dioate isomerase [Deltaproteobacteria bacterium]
MKIARYEFDGQVRYGLVEPESGTVREIAGEPFERVEATGIVRRLDEVRLLSPVVPGKIVAVGLNYKDHAREMGKKIPEEPLLFLKATSAVNDPGGEIVYTPQSQRVDYEAELAVVIGRKAKNVTSEDAASHILGYTCINDVTARDLQVKDVQYTRAKGFDTFAPLGPWVATDLDPSAASVRCLVNGEVRQDGNTREMGASVGRLVEFISSVMTLFPGDVIATGTPPGVGPLRVGDVVTVEVGGIGALTNRVVAP